MTRSRWQNDPTAIRAALARATPDRLRQAAQAMRYGFPLDEIQRITGYDPWFLGEIEAIIACRSRDRAERVCRKTRDGLRRLKAMGFSDARLAKLTGMKEADVRAARARAGRAPLLQAHRHLRRRIRGADALHVFDL